MALYRDAMSLDPKISDLLDEPTAGMSVEETDNDGRDHSSIERRRRYHSW